ncbi:MAG: heme ABC transporter permease [Gammaproteobacteria bacterium]|nr:heme ABC transporter permease [Gammaproteobacteria bacterium]
MIIFLRSLLSPKTFSRFAKQCIPWLYAGFAVFFTYGLGGGLVLSPPDYQQGDAFRIIYVHVPCAFLSLLIYLIMATSAGIAAIWKIKLADHITRTSAPIGASFTLLALITGALWGKPMWGTYWIWDARLTSELILLFLYLGYIAAISAFSQQRSAEQVGRIIVLVGAINIPIIHYSVYWWNTLHQGATLSKLAKPSMDAQMLYPLLAMIVAFFLFYLAVLLTRMHRIISSPYANSATTGA